MPKLILFAAAFAAGVAVGNGTWTGVGTITPISAIAGSAVDSSAMMKGAKNLPASHYLAAFVGP